MIMQYLPVGEFQKIETSVKLDDESKLRLIAKMCRFNTYFEVKNAGSGHLGSSFSAMDIVVYLLYRHMNIRQSGFQNQHRDIYFSSKGHDVPGYYSVLYSLGFISESKFLRLRKLGGLDGHPDIKVTGIEANTGSLGMGISKARGMAYAKKHFGYRGRVFVLTGDGELQEGQNFEAMQAAVSQNITNLTVIIDHNKLQSDRPIVKIVDLQNLEDKFSSFGWFVKRCDGHDFDQLKETFQFMDQVVDRPKILICDTIKGKGVSFLEHPYALEKNQGYYRWHSGAPDDESYQKGGQELQESILEEYRKWNLGEPCYQVNPPQKTTVSGVSKEYVSAAYGDTLCRLAEKKKDFVVLDADLSADCKILDFEKKYPDRFVECGIAEQDMVSMAGGMALQGLLPIVNSFACFLASRANEQIYNNLTENKKIVYAMHYAGLIPAGPGKSHQSLRDISLIAANPNCIIMQAANEDEMKMITEYAIMEAQESCVLRINIGPSPRVIRLPDGYQLCFGKGVRLTEGQENVLVSYGPVMLNEALVAYEILKRENLDLRIINMPWLNRIDTDWWKKELRGTSRLFILDDHMRFGGLADGMIDAFLERNISSSIAIQKYAIEGFPACGTPQEVLQYHHLDGESLASRIRSAILGQDS